MKVKYDTSMTLIIKYLSLLLFKYDQIFMLQVCFVYVKWYVVVASCNTDIISKNGNICNVVKLNI